MTSAAKEKQSDKKNLKQFSRKGEVKDAKGTFKLVGE